MQEDIKNRFEMRKQQWEDRAAGRTQNTSHVWTGLLILAIGAIGLIRVAVPNVPHWLFSWQMLLIVLGLFIGVRHQFRGAAWFILILVGSVFLFNSIFPILTFRYIWPLVLMVIGAFIIFQPRHRWRSQTGEKKNMATTVNTLDDTKVAGQTCFTPKDIQEDFVDSTSIFGGAKKNIFSKNFKGGDIVNIFGGTELDLTRADFTGTAVVEITTIFGGTKFIVPSHWTVKSEAVTIFGGLEDKRNIPTNSGTDDKVLILKGTVIFGGIEIKSY